MMESCCSQLTQSQQHHPQHNSFRIDSILTGMAATGHSSHASAFNLTSSINPHHQSPPVVPKTELKPFSGIYCKTEELQLQEPKRESVSSVEDDDDGCRKKKKPRTAFSREQVAELEKKFTERKYLSSAERGELAQKLNLSDMQVKTWFQNRRMKFKRQTEEAELEVKSPKFPYSPFVPAYSSFYSYMPYKASDVMQAAAYGCTSPPTTDPYSLVLSSTSQHLSPPPASRIGSNYFNTATGGPHPSCYPLGGYITGSDYTTNASNVSSQYVNGDWSQRSVLPTPPAAP